MDGYDRIRQPNDIKMLLPRIRLSGAFICHFQPTLIHLYLAQDRLPLSHGK